MTHTALADRYVQAAHHYDGRGGATITHIGIHHIGGTAFEAAVEAWRSGSEQGSAHVTISNEGVIVAMLDEADGAWSFSNETADCFSLVMEIENQTGAPDWSISDAAFEAAARVSADWRERYGPLAMWGHNQYAERGYSYPTFCPGPAERVDRINNRANELLENDMPIYELVRTETDMKVWFVVDRVQRLHVADEGTLKDYQYFITAAGQKDNAAVKVVKNLNAFGVDISTKLTPSLSDAQIAQIAGAIDIDPADIAAAVRAEFATNPLR